MCVYVCLITDLEWVTLEWGVAHFVLYVLQAVVGRFPSPKKRNTAHVYVCVCVSQNRGNSIVQNMAPNIVVWCLFLTPSPPTSLPDDFSRSEGNDPPFLPPPPPIGSAARPFFL